MLPEVELGSPEWLVVLPLIILGFLLYCVSFITFVAHAVWMAPRWASHWPGFLERYRFAFGVLRLDRWWWVLFYVCYCLGLTCVQITTSSAHSRLLLLTTLILTYGCMCFYAHPWKFRKNNHVDLHLQTALLFFCDDCICFY